MTPASRRRLARQTGEEEEREEEGVMDQINSSGLLGDKSALRNKSQCFTLIDLRTAAASRFSG